MTWPVLKKTTKNSIEESSCFLVDISKVPFENLLCDNMGVWINNGTPKTFLKHENGILKILNNQDDDFDFVITRKYFKHKLIC